MTRLSGRTALVTGGTAGIGNAIATELGREGAAVAVGSRTRSPTLDEERSVFQKLDEVGAENRFVELDVRDEAMVEAAVEETIEAFGGLDILVNNAGVYYRNPLHQTTTEEWDATLSTNLRGTFLCTKAALPALQDSASGKIINVSSTAGFQGSTESAAYCASKGGINAFSRQLAVDYAADEINVNVIAPGYIRTAQNNDWHESQPEVIEAWRSATPWPRDGTPEDVASAAVFLASDESNFITGQVLPVDGGSTA